ncbi:MAG TPA: HAD family hydrolase [Clostridiales bacterium]|nr:HAD family hydrolase [Clostridiales bacterium]
MNTVIFDLDGTLLPMPDQEQFVRTYFKAMAMKLNEYGYEEENLINGILAGTKAMLDNDGSINNRDRFWKTFIELFGQDVTKLEHILIDFYNNEFAAAKKTTSLEPLARDVVETLKAKGYQLVLGTNPLFPSAATYNRILWAGLSRDDFTHITTYENSSYCKPKLEYYKEILKAIGKEADECIMVGNDVGEDMIVRHLGMDTFLLKDCLINRDDEDISEYKQGYFKELLDFVNNLDPVGCSST